MSFTPGKDPAPEYRLVTLFEWHKKFNLEAAIGDDYVMLQAFILRVNYYFRRLLASRGFLSLDALIGMGTQSFAEVTDFTLPSFVKETSPLPQTGIAEYVYSSKSFISLKGKSLHSKRNHISQFVSSYKYAFETYNPPTAQALCSFRLMERAKACLAAERRGRRRRRIL